MLFSSYVTKALNHNTFFSNLLVRVCNHANIKKKKLIGYIIGHLDRP